MARKTRINAQMRDKLKSYVWELEPKELAAARDVALFSLTGALNTEILKLYPQSDMHVLKKYDCSEEATHVSLKDRDSQDLWGNTKDIQLLHQYDGATHMLLLVPRQRHRYVHIDVDSSSDIWSMYLQYQTAKDACSEARKELQSAYHTLIAEHTYVEDLAAVWPEVPAILKRPVKKDPETSAALDIVKRDLCERGVATCEE